METWSAFPFWPGRGLGLCRPQSLTTSPAFFAIIPSRRRGEGDEGDGQATFSNPYCYQPLGAVGGDRGQVPAGMALVRAVSVRQSLVAARDGCGQAVLSAVVGLAFR
jgi:hypothetical protein